ncbi:MAG: arginine deiminase [Bacilli bacterium]
MKPIHVTNEIGTLRKVLLHRPGKELENLTPDLLERLLFDDIPYLKTAAEEHDSFAEALRKEGVEVFYLTDLVVEVLDSDSELKTEFIHQFINESRVVAPAVFKALAKYFLSLSTRDMVDKMIAGVRDYEVQIDEPEALSDMVKVDYPFITDPLPNLYFQRDPFSSVGDGALINKMKTDTRNRETIFADYIFKYHPEFKTVKRYYNRENEFSIEGGDVLVLSKDTLAVGISERTSAAAIEELANSLFFENETEFNAILAFNIPNRRAFMHLDTVFTQIDYDKFTIHPEILGTLEVYELTKKQDKIHIEKMEDTLEAILSKYLGKKVELIPCGGGDDIASSREQWNDGANTLCIRPGVVVVYSRNWVTNELLRKKGITVIEVPSSELSRGRGGPRCMSMPLYREDL